MCGGKQKKDGGWEGVEDFLHINTIMANTLQCFKSFRDGKDIRMQF